MKITNKIVTLKKMAHLLCFSFILFSFNSFGQQVRNEENNRIMVSDATQKGWLEIFVDPTGFECECTDVPSVLLKPTSTKNSFQSEDKSVLLEIKATDYIVTIKGDKKCCFLKEGTYR